MLFLKKIFTIQIALSNYWIKKKKYEEEEERKKENIDGIRFKWIQNTMNPKFFSWDNFHKMKSHLLQD